MNRRTAADVVASSRAEARPPDIDPALERDRPTRSEASEKSPTASNEKQGRAPPSPMSTIRRHPVMTILITVVALVGAAGVAVWWLNARHYESTDDAFIDARMVSISSQVNAAIVDVPVNDNQDVEAGTPLVHLDDRDFRAAVDEAKAQIDQAVAGVWTSG